jgi:hypothetical protein
MKPWTLLLILLSGAALAAPSERLFAGGSWAALRFGESCVAGARPLPPASRREPQARAGFRFDRGGGRFGEFHVRLSRAPRAGSAVMLRIGDQPFLLAVEGDWAWSREPAQSLAIIAAARGSRSMRVEARDRAGRRFRDAYLLDGAPTAIDAAAAGCAALKGTGKI